MRSTPLVILLLVATVLAGCADGGTGLVDDAPPLDVTETTGGIRGVVVDQAITPIEGATVTLLQSGQSVQTDADGLFKFTGLEPGTYFLSTEKLLYEGVQTSVAVQAGVANPPLVNIQIARIAGLNPFREITQFTGFYECAFALFFITDSCDMAARTVHDEGVDPVPRSIQNNVNTDFYTWSSSIQTIVQEAFWDTSATSRLWIMVDSTPIDNGCDCSEYTYVEATGESPTYARADMPTEAGVPWPEDGKDVAIRGFVPFTDNPQDVQYALNVEFEIFTTFFHNYKAQEGWNILEESQYPVPE